MIPRNISSFNGDSAFAWCSVSVTSSVSSDGTAYFLLGVIVGMVATALLADDEHQPDRR
jgi:hypothetical protein